MAVRRRWARASVAGAATIGLLVSSTTSSHAAPPPPVTTLESKAGAGVETRVPAAAFASIAGDSRFIAFVATTGSAPTSLRAATASRLGVFVRDRFAGALVEASAPAPGTVAGNSVHPAVSRNGCHVAFVTQTSWDPRRDPGPGTWDVYRWTRPDCGGGRPVLVSLDAKGLAKGNVNPGQRPAISGDGRIIAFVADGQATEVAGGNRVYATDLAQPDPALRTRAIPDRTTGAPVRSFQYVGSIQPALSDDGTLLAFTSDAVPPRGWATGPCKPPTTATCPATTQVWVFDRAAGSFTQGSATASGAADGPSAVPALSAKGRILAFTTKATNLVPAVGHRGGSWDVVAVDLGDRSAVQLTRNGGGEGNGDSGGPPLLPGTGGFDDQVGSGVSISADGAWVALQTMATNLAVGAAPGDISRGREDVLVAERRSGRLERISSRPDGSAATMGSARPSLSSDGRLAAFDSVVGSQLLGVDVDLSTTEVYLRDRPPEPPPPTTTTTPTTTIRTTTTQPAPPNTSTTRPAPPTTTRLPPATTPVAATSTTESRSTTTSARPTTPTLPPPTAPPPTTGPPPSGPTLAMEPAVVRPGELAVAVGRGFPPGTAVHVRWQGAPTGRAATTDAAGGFRLPVMVLHQEAPGPRLMTVADEPGRWSAVAAPCLVAPNTFTPPNALGPAGQRSLVSRG